MKDDGLKRVEAVIRVEKQKEVKSGLAKHGLIGLTVLEVKGRGRQGVLRFTSVKEYKVDLLPKAGIGVNDDNVDQEWRDEGSIRKS